MYIIRRTLETPQSFFCAICSLIYSLPQFFQLKKLFLHSVFASGFVIRLEYMCLYICVRMSCAQHTSNWITIRMLCFYVVSQIHFRKIAFIFLWLYVEWLHAVHGIKCAPKGNIKSRIFHSIFMFYDCFNVLWLFRTSNSANDKSKIVRTKKFYYFVSMWKSNETKISVCLGSKNNCNG